MARFEGKFEAEANGALDDRELLALLAIGSATTARRSELVALYLSAQAGWREAASVLGGAFASGEKADDTGLSKGKEA